MCVYAPGHDRHGRTRVKVPCPICWRLTPASGVCNGCVSETPRPEPGEPGGIPDPLADLEIVEVPHPEIDLGATRPERVEVGGGHEVHELTAGGLDGGEREGVLEERPADTSATGPVEGAHVVEPGAWVDLIGVEGVRVDGMVAGGGHDDISCGEVEAVGHALPGHGVEPEAGGGLADGLADPAPELAADPGREPEGSTGGHGELLADDGIADAVAHEGDHAELETREVEPGDLGAVGVGAGHELAPSGWVAGASESNELRGGHTDGAVGAGEAVALARPLESLEIPSGGDGVGVGHEPSIGPALPDVNDKKKLSREPAGALLSPRFGRAPGPGGRPPRVPSKARDVIPPISRPESRQNGGPPVEPIAPLSGANESGALQKITPQPEDRKSSGPAASVVDPQAAGGAPIRKLRFKSTNIDSAELEPGDVVLVTFAGGASYRYGNFTQAMLLEWGRAPSAGAWFHRTVKMFPKRHPMVRAVADTSGRTDTSPIVDVFAECPHTLLKSLNGGVCPVCQAIPLAPVGELALPSESSSVPAGSGYPFDSGLATHIGGEGGSSPSQSSTIRPSLVEPPPEAPSDEAHGSSDIRPLRTLTRAEATALLTKLTARRLTANFRDFVHEAWTTLEGNELEWNFHHDAFCMHAQIMIEEWHLAGLSPTKVGHQLEAWRKAGRPYVADLRAHWEGTCKRGKYKQRATDLAVNVGPISLKSRIFMVMFPAWVWTWLPSWSVFCASGTTSNVDRDSRDCRDLVSSSWYRDTFSIEWEIRDDQNRIEKWGTTAGALRESRGTDSDVVGIHVDCVTGETLVATEHGDIAVEDLVRMHPTPRVWSHNHATGERELAVVRATRRIENRPTVDVVMDSGHVLRCTDDHQIWTTDGYRSAKDCIGRTVSVMWGSEPARHQRATSVPGVYGDHAHVRDMYADVRPRGGRASQARAQGDQVRPVLLETLSASESRRPGYRAGLRDVRGRVQTAGVQGHATSLFASLCGGEPAAPGTQVRRSTVCTVQDHDGDPIGAKNVLLDAMQERGPLCSDVRDGECQLQRSEQALLRRVVGEPGAPDPRTRWVRVHDMRFGRDRSSTGGAPHRRGSAQQPAGESDHALRPVPRHTPQVGGARVLSVHPTIEGGRRATHEVYDLDVAGNNNFFASGVLVHNCHLLDDPDSSTKVWSDAARRNVMLFWHGLGNRLNDIRRPFRIIVQQNLHEEDLTTRTVLAGMPRLAIPVEFRPADRSKLYTAPYGWRDPRELEGELIHEARFPLDVIAAERLRLGTHGFEAQYNCNPRPIGGGLIKSAWFRFFRIEDPREEERTDPRPRPAGCMGSGGEFGTMAEHRAYVLRRKQGKRAHANELEWMSEGQIVQSLDLDWLTLSVDATFGSLKESASAVALCVFGGQKERRFVFDDQTEPRTFTDTKKAIAVLVRKWGPKRILIEKKANGAPVIEDLEIWLAEGKLIGPDGKPIHVVLEAIEVPGGKESRAAAMVPSIEAGLWYLLEGAHWLPAYVGELTTFPHAKRDDRVDATSQLATYYREPDVVNKWRAMGKK